VPQSANEHNEQIRAIVDRFQPRKILDVGMGRGDYGVYLRRDWGWTQGFLVGLEIWEPYIRGENAVAKEQLQHYNAVHVLDVRDASDLVLEEKPDLVFAFDVLEHMPQEDAVRVLRMLQRASKYGVLVSLPIIPYPQGPYLGNPYEAHQKDWTPEEMLALGSEFLHRGVATGLFHFPGGVLDRRISVLMNTVRENEAFSIHPHDILAGPVEQVLKQTVSPHEVEIIIVDGLHFERWPYFEAYHSSASTNGLRILHVPPKQSQMVKDKRCAISAYKNTALAHMRSPLAITIDDGAVLPATYLANVLEAWEERKEMLSSMCQILNGTEIIDSRQVFLESDGKVVGPIVGDARIPSMYGYAALPLEGVLAVNGYDEMYDGSRGIEDMDMGIRLQKAGYRIALDRTHTMQLLPHGAWSRKVFGQNICGNGGDNTCVKCCQTTINLRLSEILSGDVQANRRAWDDEKWSKVRPRCYLLSGNRCSLSWQTCPYYGSFSDREHPGLQSLIDHPPIFDMTEERRNNGIRP
jgi:hypothetical protein